MRLSVDEKYMWREMALPYVEKIVYSNKIVCSLPIESGYL